MSKANVCQFIEEHPAYSLTGESKCPDIDDRIFVALVPSEFPTVSSVGLAFDFRGRLNAIWATFPSTDFDSVYTGAVQKFGKPHWKKVYQPSKGGATFQNRLFYWHTKTTDIYLEEQNTVQRGNMTGWLALNSASSDAFVPAATFEFRPQTRVNTP